MRSKSKKVVRTQDCSFKQIQRMVYNLGQTGPYAFCIGIEHWKYSSGDDVITIYSLWNSATTENYKTSKWTELQDEYFKLMEKELSE